jgi:hypothetical protein
VTCVARNLDPRANDVSLVTIPFATYYGQPKKQRSNNRQQFQDTTVVTVIIIGGKIYVEISASCWVTLKALFTFLRELFQSAIKRLMNLIIDVDKINKTNTYTFTRCEPIHKRCDLLSLLQMSRHDSSFLIARQTTTC